MRVSLSEDARDAIRVLFQSKPAKPLARSGTRASTKSRGLDGVEGGKESAGSGGGGKAGKKGAVRGAELRILSGARANNVAIMLTQFRVAVSRVPQLLLDGDPDESLPSDRLAHLLQVRGWQAWRVLLSSS